MWRLEQNSRTIPGKNDEFQPLCLLDSRRFGFSQGKSITLRIRQWLHSAWSLLILCRMLRWFDSFQFASNIECESWRGNCSVSSWLGTRYQESIPQPLGLILGHRTRSRIHMPQARTVNLQQLGGSGFIFCFSREQLLGSF